MPIDPEKAALDAAATIPSRLDDPEPPKPATEQGKPGETDEIRDKFKSNETFWSRLMPEEEKKPEDETVKTESETPDPEKTEPPKPKVKRAKKPPEHEVDPIQIAETMGRRIGEELARKRELESTAAAPADTSTDELPEEFADDRAVYEQMAREDPKRYGNLIGKLQDYAKKETGYIESWEREHPGETFDGEDPEHNEFYASIHPNFEKKAFERAKETLVEQRLEERVAKRMQEREREQNTNRERAREIEGEVAGAVLATVQDFIKEVDPDSLEAAKEWKTINKLEETNPIAAETIVAMHSALAPMLDLNSRLFRGLEKPNPADQRHAALFQMLSRAEESVQQLPRSERYDDKGRLFASQDEYAKMTPQEQRGHWFIGEREMAQVLSGRATKDAANYYKAQNDRFDRWGKSRANVRKSPPSSKPVQHERPNWERGEVQSPSVTGRSALPGDRNAKEGKQSTGADSFWSRLIPE